jgi:nitrogen fixation NifU-like protein
MDDLYQQNILDHYKHPHHKGVLPVCDVTQQGTNPSCGDELEFCLKFDGERIVDVGHEGTGCAISQAATSMLSDKIIGMTKDEAAAISDKDIYELLGIQIGNDREKCALLGMRTLHTALKNTKVN